METSGFWGETNVVYFGLSAHLGVSFDEAKLVILRLRRPVNPLKGGHSNLVFNFKLLKLNPIHPTPRDRDA